MLAVHADVLPFDRERPGIANVIQRADDCLEIERPAPQRPEFSESPWVPKFRVTAEHARFCRNVSP